MNDNEKVDVYITAAAEDLMQKQKEQVTDNIIIQSEVLVYILKTAVRLLQFFGKIFAWGDDEDYKRLG